MSPMMQPEQPEVVIRRICRALGRVDSFALYFVLVNLPAARKALSLQVQEELTRPVVELDVPAEGFGDTTLDGWLLPQLQERDDVQPESAIFLHGLEQVMPAGQVGLRRFLQQLNWRRSALKRLGRPLVIWLPRYALKSMAEHAPDFYDWYSNVYEFASSSEEAEELQESFYTEFNTVVHPANRQSKGEKEQWLHTLIALLDEHPKRNAYRARLLAEAGLVHKASGELEDALEFYQQSLAIYQEIDNRAAEGTILSNISGVYQARGDYETALKYLEQSLDIYRKVGDRAGEGTTLNNISGVYQARGEYDTALKYLEQSLDIHREVGDRAGEGATLNNISQIYKARGDYDTALKYLEQSLVIRREIGDRAGEGTTLNNIGRIYRARGDNTKALQYYEQSLVIRREIGDRAGEAITSWNIGMIYKNQGNLTKAEQYMRRTVEIDEAIGHPDLESDRKELKKVQAALQGR